MNWSDATVHVSVPHQCEKEASWIFNVILKEFLGISFSIQGIDSSNFTIQYANQTLTLPDVFFSSAKDAWLSIDTLPKLPLVQWHVQESGIYAQLVDNTIPVLFGLPGFHIDEFGNGHLNLDIFGSAFYMLSRYEELVVQERDSHDRFPATASTAYKAGFLDRPITDEYVEILWSAMKCIWPQLERRARQGEVIVTCDVDEPYERWIKNLSLLTMGVAGALIRRRSIKAATNRIRNAIKSRNGCYCFDPNWSFEWYMNSCEQFGRKSLKRDSLFVYGLALVIKCVITTNTCTIVA